MTLLSLTPVIFAIAAVLTSTLAYSPQKSTDCPSKNWELDVANNRCLLLVTSAMTYAGAAVSCRVLGAEIASISAKDNHDQIMGMLELSLNQSETVSLWSKYHIVNRDGKFYLADDKDRGFESSVIEGTLENNNSRLCVTTSIKAGLQRQRVECSEINHFLCEYHIIPVDRVNVSNRGLAALAIALAIFLAFMIVAMIEICHKIRLAECRKSDGLLHDKTMIIPPSEDGSISTQDDKSDVISPFDFLPGKPHSAY